MECFQGVDEGIHWMRVWGKIKRLGNDVKAIIPIKCRCNDEDWYWKAGNM